ncbi:hypothetical protein Goklo_006489, partial [Gossypium klotzschianum]|nr:hypothetical protein [Gossypium klotzschianum]
MLDNRNQKIYAHSNLFGCDNPIEKREDSDRTVYARYQYEILREERDTGHNNRGDVEKSYLNPNFILLGSGQKILTTGIDNWRNMDSRELNGADGDNRPMDLVLTDENDPLLSVEGKK